MQIRPWNRGHRPACRSFGQLVEIKVDDRRGLFPAALDLLDVHQELAVVPRGLAQIFTFEPALAHFQIGLLRLQVPPPDEGDEVLRGPLFERPLGLAATDVTVADPAVGSGAFLLAAWRIDINLFSLHHFYRNRLVRAYLGASNYPNRNSHPFTGFSADDDVRMCLLRDQRPFHIINAALNFSGGDELA